MKHKISGLRDFGFLGSANIIGTGISAFFWFYLANIINEGDYGEINYFIGIAGIAYLFSSVAAPHTITVLTAKNVNIHSTLYLLSLIVGFVSFLVTLLIFHRTDIGLLIFGYLIYDLGLYYLLGRKLYARYSREFIIQKILTVVFGFGFNHFFGHETIIYGLALSYIPFTVIVYRLFRDSKIDFSLLKSHKGFITNNYFENVVGGLNGQIDKIIIAPLLGFVILGNYALAMQVYAVLMIFSNVAFKYILPQDASGGVSTKLKRSVICVSVAISVFGIIVLPIILPHFFPKYTDTANMIQITSIAIVPATIGFMYISKFLSLEKSRFVLIGRIITLAVMTTGMIILSKNFGTIGVAATVVLSVCAQTVFFVYANRKIGILKNEE